MPDLNKAAFLTELKTTTSSISHESLPLLPLPADVPLPPPIVDHDLPPVDSLPPPPVTMEVKRLSVQMEPMMDLPPPPAYDEVNPTPPESPKPTPPPNPYRRSMVMSPPQSPTPVHTPPVPAAMHHTSHFHATGLQVTHTEVIKEGYLSKGGSSGVLGWKRRYFVLKSQGLSYYEKPPEQVREKRSERF